MTKRLCFLIIAIVTTVTSVNADDAVVVISSLSSFSCDYSSDEGYVTAVAGNALMRNESDKFMLLQGVVEALLKEDGTLRVNSMFEDTDGVEIFIINERRKANILNHSYGGMKAYLVDMSGYHLVEKNIEEGREEIDLSDITPGVYMIICVVDNRICKYQKFAWK